MITKIKLYTKGSVNWFTIRLRATDLAKYDFNMQLINKSYLLLITIL